MNVSFLGICIVILLLCIPAYIIFTYKLNLLNKFAMSVVKMLSYMVLTGVFLYYISLWNSVFVNILWMILMTAIAAVITVSKTKLSMSKMFVPSFIGALSVVVVMGLAILFAVFSFKNMFDARYMIPVTGFLVGSMIECNAKSLETYYSGLKNHNALYYYLLGNGATHSQAVSYFVKRALEKNMIPMLGKMAYILLGVTPMVLWSMILAGTDIADAIFMQILMLSAMLAAAPVSLLITLALARSYFFDAYGQLKNMDNNA